VTFSIGLVGGRGYVGEALLELLLRHPELEIAWVASRSLQGRTVHSVYPAMPIELAFESLAPADVASREADVVVLALPNGLAADYVRAVDSRQKIIDISADYRFDDTWSYGLPEHYRQSIGDAIRVSNPGCYATAVQLAIAPILPMLQGVPAAFGLSGFSGAGRTPSPRNDPDRLTGNILPYSLAGHVHEREISHHLQHGVRFMPHVAGFFRGISVTISATLSEAADEKSLLDRYEGFYARERLVEVTKAIPEIRNVANTPYAQVGGLTVDPRDPRRISVVACIDNLLKGAASQAMQNMNLMLGMDECLGVTEIE